MGDYGFGLNTNIRALSPVDFDQLSNNQSLFSPDFDSPRTMQDETLLEKPAAKQSQQLSPNTTSNGSHQILIEDSVSKRGKTENSSPVNDEKKSEPLSSVSSPLQLGLSEHGTSINTSLASAPANFWPTATPAGPDDTFLQGFQALNGTVTFQHFPPAPNTVFNTNLPPHMGMNVPQQQPHQPRRAITGHHNFPQNQRQHQQSNMILNNSKSYPTWSSAPQQTPSWTGQQNQATLSPWGGIQQQHRRSAPNLQGNPMASLKKNFPQNLNHHHSSIIAPSKFRRSTSYPGHIQQGQVGSKQSYEISGIDDFHRDGIPSFQDRSGTYDTMRFPSLESHLLDIMRSTADSSEHMKGKFPFTCNAFTEENTILDDSCLDQTVPNLSPRGSPSSQPGMERVERFSRKVFVGGLPPDIDEEEITAAFRRFGPLVVDWPHKAESKSYFPPKGYCFLLFQDEMSVQALIESCILDDDKLYWCVSSPTMKDKPVQIRPWSLSDSDFVMDGSQPLDPRKTIFVGGVPRPLRAVELAMIMDRLYGGVCYAGIDTDPELKYPKGAGRVAFSNQQSYIAAISARFVQLQHGDIDKRVEVKPYVLDDQMCDECQGARCGGKFAPFFCANVTCLQYYCEHCWAQIHSRPGREFHKPLVKEGADRPRAVPFRWC
ncbi:cytoplasmic polyadenylation element-binding protein 2-like isoform X2 [Liolophura sinensis]|uniref:cytoplasmic polyadenylation element-binding protein 2-like isoform X2 n=1 Tax=Liolophura sinensis TaxID=3198878 RepID=UPI003158AAB0